MRTPAAEGRRARVPVRRFGAALLAASAIVLLAPAPSWACWCVERSDESRFAGARLVFIGVARDAMEKPSLGSEIWTFDVERVQKGPAGDVERVQTDHPGSSCAFQFQAGQPYQVFAGKGDPAPTDLCSGTRHLAAGTEPYEPAPPTALIVGAVAGALALAWSFRRIRDARINAGPGEPID